MLPYNPLNFILFSEFYIATTTTISIISTKRVEKDNANIGVMNRGPDVWAGISADHLQPKLRREAAKAKDEIILLQEGRTMLRAPFETGEKDPRSYVIDTVAKFEQFFDEALETASRPTILVMETKGNSDCWSKARKEFDGDAYYKNDESSGVTIILVNVIVSGMENRMAFIDAKKIVENELEGVPNLPACFGTFLKCEMVTVIAESVVKHLKRLENSFFATLDGVLYVTLEDLTDRWTDNKRENRYSWEFEINPSKNSGLLVNFHQVFHSETFFKNPYEVLADYSEMKELRHTMLVHALNKVHYTALLIERILEYFVHWRLSLSAMGTVFPRCESESRVDIPNKNFIRLQLPPPRWDEETRWPNYLEQRYGDSSRAAAIEDPDKIREKQAKRDKKRRRDNPPNRHEKRKYVVSDVSDDEDADDARRKRKIGENEARRRGERVARRLRLDQTTSLLRAHLAPDPHDDVLFVATVLENMKAHRNKAVSRRILDYYAKEWPNDRKELLIATLSVNRFFVGSSHIPAFAMMKRLCIGSPAPRSLLMYDVTSDQMAKHVAGLRPHIRRRIADFLEEYLSAPLEDRANYLTTLDFYVASDIHNYVLEDDRVELLLRRVCTEGGMMPGERYFRLKRPKFIDELVESGRQKRVSVENAALSLAVHAGEDYDDKRDAVVMAARWPRLAEILHKRWNLIGNAPRVIGCDKNLKEDVGCHPHLHTQQTDHDLNFVRDRAGFEALLATHSHEDLFIVETRKNRHPRKFDSTPSLITFRAPGRAIFAFFPPQMSEELREEIFSFLASKIIFTLNSDFAKFVLAAKNPNLRWINAGSFAVKFAVGRSGNAMTSFIWNRRYCVTSLEEWLTDPLTSVQTEHVAYAMNVLNVFLVKAGRENAMKCVSQKKKKGTDENANNVD